jgi:hypothetical protein
MARCFKCDQQITFSPDQVSKKSGSLIPLDPDTGESHDCPMNEYPKGNHRSGGYKKPVVKAMTVIGNDVGKAFYETTLEKFNDVQERFNEVYERFKFQQGQITVLQQEMKSMRQQQRSSTANNDDNSNSRIKDSE